MKLSLLILFVSLACLNAASVKRPKFDDTIYNKYTVSGVLRLPYPEIVEPFTAYYDINQQASRIDYYDGMVITIQQQSPNGGASAKRVPVTTEDFENKPICFWQNGTATVEIHPQSVIPDLSEFTYNGQTVYQDKTADEWVKQVKSGSVVNNYRFLADSDSSAPLYYEFIGFDKFYFEYNNDFSTDDIDPSVFEIPDDWNCQNIGDPIENNRVLMNPMREFIHGDESHIDFHFNEFKNKHNKNYRSNKEHEKRRHNFKQNFRYIESMNRKGLSYKLKVNHLADKSDEELAVLRGRLSKSKMQFKSNAQKLDMKNFQTDLPESFDWRILGAVSPVKDQAQCGSCWAFATSEVIESAYFLKYNEMIHLSPQNLMDCTWGFGNYGCDGGLDFQAYEWILKHGGIATDQSYGAYLQQDGVCHFGNATVGAQLTGYVNITPYDANILKTTLYNVGPISIGIDAGHKSFAFYSHGVYYEPQCGNKPEDLDHAVLLVGYGKLNGEDYWLVRNSWSTYWGNDGYILMSTKNNNCGVLTDTTYPIVA